MSYTIASPYALAGSASGGYSGSNTGQTGDLSNWFAWTCPATDHYIWSTRALAGITPPVLPTILACYQLSPPISGPVTLADLTNLSADFVPEGKEPNGYGYETGSQIALSFTSGTTYYFQVNSRDGTTGNFNLAWKTFQTVTLGPCGSCNQIATGLCKVAEATVGDMTVLVEAPLPSSVGLPVYLVSGLVDLGTLASGFYYWIYCGGAWDLPSSGWNMGTSGALGVLLFTIPAGDSYYGFIDDGDPSYGGGNSPNSDTSFVPGQICVGFFNLYICITAVTYLAGTSFSLDGDPNWAVYAPLASLNGGAGAPYATQVACEQANSCLTAFFCFSGGDVSMLWLNDTSGFTNGTPNPTFALFRFSPGAECVISLNSITNTGASGSGYTYSVTVKIQNSNLKFASGPFSVALVDTAGISSASAAVSFDSIVTNGIAAGANATATFTFYSATQDLLNGTFQIYNCNGDSDGTAQTIVLASALVYVVTGGNFVCGGCSTAPCLYSDQINFTNIGVIPISSVSFVITTPNALFTAVTIDTTGQGSAPNASVCARTASTSSLSGSTGVIAPNDGFAYAHFGVIRNGGAAGSRTLTVASNVGSIVFANFTTTIYLD